MPLDRYFSGHGKKTMAAMKRQYGDKKGERVFYATAKRRGQEPSSGPRSEMVRRYMRKKRP